MTVTMPTERNIWRNILCEVSYGAREWVFIWVRLKGQVPFWHSAFNFIQYILTYNNIYIYLKRKLQWYKLIASEVNCYSRNFVVWSRTYDISKVGTTRICNWLIFFLRYNVQNSWITVIFMVMIIITYFIKQIIQQNKKCYDK